MAAVQVTKMGKTVVIVSPDKHLGGLSSGGLGLTDTGDKSVIGGLSREFYQSVCQHYSTPAAWKWQKREEYGNKGQGTPAMDGEHRTMWIFEPHVAEQVFEELREEQDSGRSRSVARSHARQGRRQAGRSHRVDHHAERTHLHRARCSSTRPTKAT